MSDDFYKTLGVSKTSTPEEIKSAYKKMAIKHHPDRNQDSKAAAEKKMKEINEAYETLRDEQKRAAYDRYGKQGGQQGGFGGGGSGFAGSGGFGGFEDIFNDINEMFGGAGGGRKKQSNNASSRGSDLRYTLKISLKEAFLGVKKTIEFAALGHCGDCNGKGGESLVTCRECDGTGSIRYQQGFFIVENTCHKCNGVGSVIKNPCKSCKGAGRVQKKFNIEVDVPRGVKMEDVIKIDGKGEAGLRGGRAGDLYVAIKVDQHEIFTRNGNDLTCEIPVKFTKAILGGKIDVPTIDGDVIQHNISSGVQNGENVKISGKGMYKYNSTSRGDLIIKIKIETPTNLSSDQKKIIQDFESGLKDNNSPNTNGFLNRIKKIFG